MYALNCNCLRLQEFSQPVNIFCKRAKGSYKKKKKKKHSINKKILIFITNIDIKSPTQFNKRHRFGSIEWSLLVPK